MILIKLILAFILNWGFSAQAQSGFYISPQANAIPARDQFVVYQWWSATAIEDSKYSMVFQDSTKVYLRVSKIYLDSIQPRNNGQPNNFLCFLADSTLGNCPKDSLFLSWNNITSKPTIPDNTNQLTNGAGFLTSINSSMVNTALGYTAANNTTVALKLNISDTAAIVANYYKKPNGVTSQYIRGDGTFATTPTGTVTSVGVASGDFSISGSPVTTSGNITANLNTSGISAGTYMSATFNNKGIATAGVNPTIDTLSASRIFNFAYQISASSYVRVNINVSLSCALTLSGGTAGEVYLEKSANGTSGWVLAGEIPASNTGTLTIGLATTQISGGQMSVLLPPGYYYRMRTNNTTGTPTYTNFVGTKEIY